MHVPYEREVPVMRILDLSAGNRGIWFDRNHPLATTFWVMLRRLEAPMETT